VSYHITWITINHNTVCLHQPRAIETTPSASSMMIKTLPVVERKLNTQTGNL
jgi:hypothetical protein